MQPSRVRAVFRTVAVIEAITWAGLLIGMLFKYVISDNQTGVHVFGPLHGAAFVAYLISTGLAARAFGWSLKQTLIALACSVPPFATLVFELWAARNGRLAPAQNRDAVAAP